MSGPSFTISRTSTLLGPWRPLAANKYDMLVLDTVSTTSAAANFDAAGMVTRLHATSGASGEPKLLLAYVNAGQAEDYRSYWQPSWSAAPPSFVLAPDPDGFKGDHVVKYWDPRWQTIATGMIASAIKSGFNGAYLNWVQGYADPSVTAATAADGVDPKAELIKFVGALRGIGALITQNTNNIRGLF